jgi:hypothetical protein
MDPMKNQKEKGSFKWPEKRPPAWARLLLMMLLVVLVAAAFYLANIPIINRLNER